jgi:hypothetical protein
MDFIEINESVDYENVGYVNENGMFEKASASDDVNNVVVGNPPHNLVDNQSFYRDFAKKNPPQYQQPPRQQFPRPILKQNIGTQQQQPQKKVTYDDILSSLNMKVVNGKLQIIRGDEPPPMQRGRQLHSSSQPQHPHTQAQTYTKQNDFYNKFLQAQQQQHMSEMVEEEIELTPEQIAEQQQYHKRLMMIQYVKNQQQRQRLGQIKSKKMKFV